MSGSIVSPRRWVRKRHGAADRAQSSAMSGRDSGTSDRSSGQQEPGAQGSLAFSRGPARGPARTSHLPLREEPTDGEVDERPAASTLTLRRETLSDARTPLPAVRLTAGGTMGAKGNGPR